MPTSHEPTIPLSLLSRKDMGEDIHNSNNNDPSNTIVNDEIFIQIQKNKNKNGDDNDTYYKRKTTINSTSPFYTSNEYNYDEQEYIQLHDNEGIPPFVIYSL